MPPKRPAAPAPREDPQQYVLKKQYRKAAELYRAMVKDTPEDANVALRLADCLVLDNQVPAAIQEYKRAARLYGEQGFLLKAIGVNKKVVKLDPSQAEVHESLSRLYEERGLLARPDAAPATAPVPGGEIQFGMEEASDAGPELDLRIGSAAAAAAPEPAPLPEPELGPDVADWSTDMEAEPEPAAPAAPPPDLAPAPVPADGGGLGFDFGLGAGADEAGGAAPSGGALAGFSFGLGEAGAPPAAEPAAEEISLDALGDALSDDLSADAAVSALEQLGSELAPDEAFGGDAGVAAAPAEIPRTPLFSDFTPEEFVQVVTELSHQDYPEGAVIVREGDPGDAMFVLVSGSVKVLTSARGKELQLAVLGEGEFFGEGALITGKPRTATIVANESCELLRLSREALDHIAATHPRVRQVMMQFYEQRAKNTVQAILKAQKR